MKVNQRSNIRSEKPNINLLPSLIQNNNAYRPRHHPNIHTPSPKRIPLLPTQIIHSHTIKRLDRRAQRSLLRNRGLDLHGRGKEGGGCDCEV